VTVLGEHQPETAHGAGRTMPELLPGPRHHLRLDGCSEAPFPLPRPSLRASPCCLLSSRPQTACPLLLTCG
jgi:hypothetical protein